MIASSFVLRFRRFAALSALACMCQLLAVATALADVQVRRVNGSGSREALAIVLVHGFNSSAGAAFKNKSGTHWTDIISVDSRPLSGGTTSLASAALYTLDYSSLTNATAAAADTSIEDISRSIADKDAFRAIFREHRHVWIVAHSMGGVVAKRALIKLNALEPEAWRSLLGMSLIAVPANGAPLASRATDTAFGRALRAVWGVSERQLRELSGLDGGNSYLQAMRNDWSLFVDGAGRRGSIYLACAHEGLATPVTGLGVTLVEVVVVPQLYSDTKCVGEEARFAADHQQIVKPASRDAAVHEWLFTTLRTALRNADAPAGDRAAEGSRAATCASSKDEPNGAIPSTSADGQQIVSARQAVVEPNAAQRFNAMKIAEEQAKADLVRYAQQFVASRRALRSADGRMDFQESISSLAQGNLTGVQIVQSCYLDGVAWVKIQHRAAHR